MKMGRSSLVLELDTWFADFNPLSGIFNLNSICFKFLYLQIYTLICPQWILNMIIYLNFCSSETLESANLVFYSGGVTPRLPHILFFRPSTLTWPPSPSCFYFKPPPPPSSSSFVLSTINLIWVLNFSSYMFF